MERRARRDLAGFHKYTQPGLGEGEGGVKLVIERGRARAEFGDVEQPNFQEFYPLGASVDDEVAVVDRIDFDVLAELGSVALDSEHISEKASRKAMESSLLTADSRIVRILFSILCHWCLATDSPPRLTRHRHPPEPPPAQHPNVAQRALQHVVQRLGADQPGQDGLRLGIIGNGAGANEVGRLSPSIISLVWQRLPAFPALPDLSAPALPTVASGSGSEVQGSVGRRSSVIFGPHGREATRSVVWSMPALAMEGAGAVEIAAEESDEDREAEGDVDMDGDKQAQDGEDDDAGRESREGESPFVLLAPLSLSLDIAGIPGRDKKGKGRERTATVNESGMTRAIHTQPLRQQVSQGSSVGKTPTRGRVHAAHADDAVLPGVRAVPMPPLPAPERPGMYKHVLRSMVDILPTPISGADLEEDEVEPVDEISGKGKGKEPSDAQRGDAPAYNGPPQCAGTVKHRRSMPVYHATLPVAVLQPRRQDRRAPARPGAHCAA
ncbi:hypothetical protein B0H14DRAFT_3707377 [Mycena olivaceomarginata]|nr:hypothetical protein B0H14DRAFT_3707377 [Mycena olivaceomarginata]